MTITPENQLAVAALAYTFNYLIAIGALVWMYLRNPRYQTGYVVRLVGTGILASFILIANTTVDMIGSFIIGSYLGVHSDFELFFRVFTVVLSLACTFILIYIIPALYLHERKLKKEDEDIHKNLMP